MTNNFPAFKKATESIRYGGFGEEEFITGTGKIVVTTRSSTMLGTIVDMEFDLNESEMRQLQDHYDVQAKSMIKGFLLDPVTAPDGITLPSGFAWHYEAEPRVVDTYRDLHRVSVAFIISPRQGIVQAPGGSMPVGIFMIGGIARVASIEFGAIGIELLGGQVLIRSGDPILALRQLILHFDGAIVDSSPYARSITASGGITLTTSNRKYGSAALRSSGATGSKITFSIPGGLAYNTFCVEWFEYLFTADSSKVTFNSRVSEATSATGIAVNEDGRVTTQNNWIFGESLPSIPKQLLAWRHVAIVRRADFRMLRFYDGVQTGISQFSVTNNFISSTFEFAGSNGLYPSSQQGEYDELRITVGDPVYLSNFIPPSFSHPDT